MLDRILVKAIKDFHCKLSFNENNTVIKQGERTNISFKCNVPQSWLLNVNGVDYPFSWNILTEYFEPVSFMEYPVSMTYSKGECVMNENIKSNMKIKSILNGLSDNASEEEIVEASDKLFFLASKAFGNDHKTFDEIVNILYKLHSKVSSINAKARISGHIWILEY